MVRRGPRRSVLCAQLEELHQKRACLESDARYGVGKFERGGGGRIFGRGVREKGGSGGSWLRACQLLLHDHSCLPPTTSRPLIQTRARSGPRGQRL